MKKLLIFLLSFFALFTITYTNSTVVHASKIKTEKGVNKKIAKDLKMAHGWADGSLDEDGNPTDNGTPDEEYAWSALVYKIKYYDDGDYLGDLRIYVRHEFLSLSKKERNAVIRTAMRYSYGAINDYYKMSYDDIKEGPITDMYVSQTPIGISKLSNHYKFKWYE